MRKLLMLGAALLMSILAFAQGVSLEVRGSPQVCAGFGQNNQVQVMVTFHKTNFNSPSKVMQAYIYIAEHETGTKTWFSNQPARWIPVPFPGEYRIHAIVEYIMPGKTRPFMAKFTNTVIVRGVECQAP